MLCALACATVVAGQQNVTLCWGKACTLLVLVLHLHQDVLYSPFIPPSLAGRGKHGQLGDGKNGTRHYSAVPVAVLGGHSFISVCTGWTHSCGLEASGQAYCWGQNVHGQLGDGTNINSTTPVEVAGGHKFRSITCGAVHTCALDYAGWAWCFGAQAGWGRTAMR